MNNNEKVEAETSKSKTHGESENNFVNYNVSSYLCHQGKPLYGVEICHYLKPNEPIIFATVGSNKITFYECTIDDIILLSCYLDPSPNEIFFTCCWSYDPKTSAVLLAAAGSCGLIRIIFPTKDMESKIFRGHFRAINDLKFHPKFSNILLSASQDHSIRLWNIDSSICIGIFGGSDGHTDQVVSVDFDCMGNRIVSGGADNLILIWRLDKGLIKKAIEASFNFNGNQGEVKSQQSFKEFHQQFPEFSSRDVHSNIVDCVKWFGDLVISKSTTNTIICWKPDSLSEINHQPNSFSKVRRFDIVDCNCWYIRFSIDISMKYMAVGNEKGNIFLWDLQSDNPTEHIVLKHPKCNTIVRKISFSRDSKIVICVCEDSTVWRWNMLVSNPNV